MKLALISGDGLPVSGLLTIFRNVIESELGNGSLELPVVADLGFSWRPDKQHFFPRGSEQCVYPDWMSTSDAVPVGTGRAELMRELTEIRGAVARADTLDDEARAELRSAVESLAGPYEEYFTRWFEEHDVDWVCAVNMTLSDAVPVTLGLHRAAARRWPPGVPGGVLFWDHDLFGTCAIFEDGARLYPPVAQRIHARSRHTPVSPLGCHLSRAGGGGEGISHGARSDDAAERAPVAGTGGAGGAARVLPGTARTGPRPAAVAGARAGVPGEGGGDSGLDVRGDEADM
ncbi:hypothetical protein OG875_01600 [Streptomyces sp. NBC_01498]|uniref:hypothetical protein n=1 Tax=Streptomyces sp. NBC_01498 TaxID=2975870 RepID=UPI002E7C477B|nr:hypothetical protein [Streptomyces sp. NBC_01498]WTL23407.1 hypothetical protein OG875_01600 [Streptomyces sp. NBC_01498]